MGKLIMNNIEKLNKIREKCKELLELSQDRTQGKWEYSKNRDGLPEIIYEYKSVALLGVKKPMDEYDFSTIHKLPNSENDGKFIASCAGTAEAGWCTTISTIDIILGELDEGVSYNNYDRIADSIIASWSWGSFL